MYGDGIRDKTNLRTVIATNKAYRWLTIPVTGNPVDGYNPIPNHRFMQDDCRYGLIIIKSMAEIMNIDTPNTDEVIEWMQSIMGKE